MERNKVKNTINYPEAVTTLTKSHFDVQVQNIHAVNVTKALEDLLDEGADLKQHFECSSRAIPHDKKNVFWPSNELNLEPLSPRPILSVTSGPEVHENSTWSAC